MSTLYYESSFVHHGIKGQKWGVRRYQNPDGTLTAKGQKRLDYLRNRETDRAIKKYAIEKQEANVQKETDKFNAAVASNDYKKSALYEDYLSESRYNLGKSKGMLHAELNRIKTMHLSDFKEEDVESGRVVAKRIAGTVGAIALSAVPIPFSSLAAIEFGTMFNMSIPNSGERKAQSRIPLDTQVQIVSDENDKEMKRRARRNSK